jgi:F420H(2)-dependent biliverdin reductase
LGKIYASFPLASSAFFMGRLSLIQMRTSEVIMPNAQRLLTARNIWMATVRPDGRPHLIPIWFVWINDRIYICTGLESVKARNLLTNSHVSVSLEDGNNPTVAECTAALLSKPYPDEVVRLFKSKYDWNILTDDEYGALFEFTPVKWLME